MTAFYILVSDEQEATDLSMGHVSPNIREMVRTMLDWEAEMQANADRPVEAPKKRKRKKVA